MARRKIEFKPDPTDGGILNKLYITPKQRKTIRKWLCYSLVCVACLVIQDSVLGRARLFGGMVDLASAAIALICGAFWRWEKRRKTAQQNSDCE